MLRSVITFLIAMLIVSTTWAVQVHSINMANVLVVDRSQQALQQALQAAFNQVLVKMSGSRSVNTVPAIQNAHSRVNDLVVSYSYLTKKNGSSSPQWILHVVFNRSAVQSLLKNAGQAIWGNNRPLTLIWLSVPQGMGTGVLSSDDVSPLAASIQQVAQQRGVPIIFPIMDIQDQTDAALLSTPLPNNQQLMTLARRYGVQSVLVGSVINDDNNQFQAEWKLLLNDTPYEWQTSGVSVAQAATNGVNQATDMMADRLATIDSKSLQSTLIMQISGVKNLNDYVDVVAALRKLTVVSKVTVNNMTKDTLLLKVNVVGGADGLVAALKIVQQFTLQAPPADVGSNQASLFYQWHSIQQQDDNLQQTSTATVQSVSGNPSQPVNNGNDNERTANITF